VDHPAGGQAVGGLEVVARVVGHGEQRSLGPLGRDAQQLARLVVEEQVDGGPRSAEAAGAGGEQEGGRFDRLLVEP
jgi:hypothetical protein